jgi:hypothetical protein
MGLAERLNFQVGVRVISPNHKKELQHYAHW